MEYVTPPRAALVLLNFFASERDLADVLGDLSEEFQRRTSAHGHPAAKRWYWREAFRNSGALGTRELLRTPGTVLVVSLLTALGIPRFLASVMAPLTQKVQWVWIPNRFWLWYRAIALILIPLLCYVGSGALASRLVRAREFALAVAFATVSTFGVICTLWILRYSSARGRLPMGVSLSQLNGRVLLEWTTVSLPIRWAASGFAGVDLRISHISLVESWFGFANLLTEPPGQRTTRRGLSCERLEKVVRFSSLTRLS